MIYNTGYGTSEHVCRVGARGADLHELIFKGLLTLTGEDRGEAVSLVPRAVYCCLSKDFSRVQTLMNCVTLGKLLKLLYL